jgi:hypothetical protein
MPSVRRPAADNPDWYRVLYNLGVLRANSLVAMRVEATANEPPRPELLDRAQADTTELVYHATRGARWWRNRSTRPRRVLRRFLRSTMEPSAVILMAGVLAERQGDQKTTFDERSVRRRGQLLRRLRRGVLIRPSRLMEYIERRRNVAGNVYYNIACFHASHLPEASGKEKDQLTDQALDALQTFAWRAEPAEARAQLRWADDDPTLSPLRGERRFRDIVAPFTSDAAKDVVRRQWKRQPRRPKGPRFGRSQRRQR